MIKCPDGQDFHGWSIAHRVFILKCSPSGTIHSILHTKSMNILFLLSVCILIFLLLVGLITTGIVIREYWKQKYDKMNKLSELKRKLSSVHTV